MITGPKVLLICQSSKRQKFYANTLPPLGILGIASNLHKHNIPADIIDYNIERSPKVDFKDYDIIGLSINMSNVNASLELIRYIKSQNPKAKVIIGGPSCMSNPEYFTQYEEIDAICNTEGEEVFLDYVRGEGFLKVSEVSGLYTKNRKGQFVYGGIRGYIKDLDNLPFPALNKVRLDRYNVLIGRGFPVSSIISSRGCPFNCIFCFHSMGHKWRARSPENVVDEIEWQVMELGVKEVCIQDDNFSLDIDRAEQIFELIIDRKIKVKLQFHNGIRTDKLELKLLNKMRQAGVWLLAVAPETGSLEMKKQIKKEFDLERMKQVVTWCKKLDIKTFSFFLIGFPFETTQDIRRTASFIRELGTDFMQLARVKPIPTTPLFEDFINNNSSDMLEQEQRVFFGTPKYQSSKVSEKELARLIKQIYRDFYLNPIKMLKLVRILPLYQLIRLFIYSIRTRNI